MARKSDALEKLEYAEARYQELIDKVFQGGIKKEDVKFIGSLAGDILASVREVYDYAAFDIFEKYASAVGTKDKKPYYPFYGTQLSATGFFGKIPDIALYKELCDIAKSIENGSVHQNTSFEYKNLTDMADMVNQKKHDRILEIKTNQKAAIYHSSGDNNLKIMLNIADQKGVSKLSFDSGGVTTGGHQYFFEYNKKDMLKFCLSCIGLTKILINKIYTHI